MAWRSPVTEGSSGRADVETSASLGEQFQDCAIGVRFDGVADQVIERSQRRIEPVIVIEDGSGAIDIEGSTEFLRDARERGFLAIEFAVAVMERMHRAKM